jgi:hypothetical protein
MAGKVQKLKTTKAPSGAFVVLLTDQGACRRYNMANHAI